MSERTRLDEIVDNESKPVRTVGEFALAVAERAFRHGVEQELAREHGGHPHTRAEPASAFDVQDRVSDGVRRLKESIEAQCRALGEERCREMVAEGWTLCEWTTTEGRAVILHAQLTAPAPAPASFSALPTPPSGFCHMRKEATLDRILGRWYWFGPLVTPARWDQPQYTSGSAHAWELEGPPPVPRFEHTGEYRDPKFNEWFVDKEDGLPDRAICDYADAKYWILRKVVP